MHTTRVLICFIILGLSMGISFDDAFGVFDDIIGPTITVENSDDTQEDDSTSTSAQTTSETQVTMPISLPFLPGIIDFVPNKPIVTTRPIVARLPANLVVSRASDTDSDGFLAN